MSDRIHNSACCSLNIGIHLFPRNIVRKSLSDNRNNNQTSLSLRHGHRTRKFDNEISCTISRVSAFEFARVGVHTFLRSSSTRTHLPTSTERTQVVRGCFCGRVQKDCVRLRMCVYIHFLLVMTSLTTSRTHSKKRKSPADESMEPHLMEPIGQNIVSIQNTAEEIMRITIVIPTDLALLIARYYEEAILGKRGDCPNLWKYLLKNLWSTSTALSWQLDWEALLVGPKHVFFMKRWTNHHARNLQFSKLHGDWLSLTANFYFQRNEVEHSRGIHRATNRDAFTQKLVSLCHECSLFLVPLYVPYSSVHLSFERKINGNGRSIPLAGNDQCQYITAPDTLDSANYYETLCKNLFQ